MTPGRTATDGAAAVRNCVWACVVRQLQGKGLSWDEVDQALLPEAAHSGAEARPKAFYRYFNDGHDPARLAGGKLIRAVHENAKFRVAEQIYNHPIWVICGPVAPGPEELVAFRHLLMGRLGLHRPTVLERLVAAYHQVPGFSTYAPSRADVGESMYNLAEGGSLDALGVCVCNYLLALDCGRLDAAMVHQEVLRWGLIRFCAVWRIRSDASSALGLLVEQRVMRRRHGALPASALGFPLGEHVTTPRSTTPAGITHFIDDLPCMLPVVPRTGDTEAFFAEFPDHHREFANALALKEAVISKLNGAEALELSLDWQKNTCGVEEVLDVPEDQYAVVLEALHLGKHISEAYAHLAEFLPPPPATRLRYSRSNTALAAIALRAGWNSADE